MDAKALRQKQKEIILRAIDDARGIGLMQGCEFLEGGSDVGQAAKRMDHALGEALAQE